MRGPPAPDRTWVDDTTASEPSREHEGVDSRKLRAMFRRVPSGSTGKGGRVGERGRTADTPLRVVALGIVAILLAVVGPFGSSLSVKVARADEPKADAKNDAKSDAKTPSTSPAPPDVPLLTGPTAVPPTPPGSSVGSFGLPVPASQTSGPATALYYGKDPPYELFAHYDRVVIEADHFAAIPASSRAQLFAYVSLGEAHPTRTWFKDVPKHLVLGSDKTWGSALIDTKNPEWKTFVLDRVIEPLWRKGYRGFFFDTLDSYERVVRDAAGRAEHAKGIGAILAALEARHPDAKVVMNRGFDVLPHVPRVDGLVAESLFATCAANGKDCSAMKPEQTEALLKRLREAQAAKKMPITIVDYAPSADLAKRKAIAKKIQDLGFDAWVTSPKLDEYGVGRVEMVPRRILMLYKQNDEGYLGVQDACVLVAPILEWMGYAVDYADVRKPLPSQSLVGRYAGVVTLIPEGVDQKDQFRNWVVNQIDAGIKVVFLEGFGFDPDPEFLSKLGLGAPNASIKPPMKIANVAKEYFGFEAPLRVHARERPPVLASRSDVKSLLQLEDAAGSRWDGAVVAPWGGAAFIPYVIEERLEQERRWILDPFKYLKAALDLPPIPAPDVTTEGGRRIMTAHLDGDAFVSRAERRGTPFTAEIVLDEILRRYRIPHTVSIVEGEVAAHGQYPQHTAKLEPFARKIFALPHVEIATHTFSHPFEWEDAEAGKTEPHLPHLPIKGYKFNLERDIKGSVDYINGLAPPGKQVKVVLWSGNCSPSDKAVGLATRLGLYNVNGGGSVRTTDLPSMTRGSAMGIPKAEGIYQVFAPVENENVYTNDWLGPFDGYRHAVETYQLNEDPRRLSVLTIYYHFYSAAKTAALVAVKKVYDWAIEQETTPMYLSGYAPKVLSFQRLSLAKRPDGVWEMGNLGEMRTFRVDPELGFPDPSKSTPFAGIRDVKQGRYMHLTEDKDRGVFVLGLQPKPSTQIQLLHANGRARSWRVDPSGTKAKIRVTADMPLEIAVAAKSACRLAAKSAVKTTVVKAPLPSGLVVTEFELPNAMDTGEVELDCK